MRLCKLDAWLAESSGIGKIPISITYSPEHTVEAIRKRFLCAHTIIVGSGPTGSDHSSSPLRYSAQAWLMSPEGSVKPLGKTTIFSLKPIA